ncbi:MAG: hypothetical protein ACFBSG_11005 [Leptolyngbyaceae cyanobacterium]
MIFSNLNYRQFVKAAVALFVCTLLFIGSATSAFAIGSTPSDSSKGVAELNDLKETSRKAVRDEPRSKDEVKGKAQRGPNEVQGDADLNKMKNPGNSQQSKTVAEQAENALENLAGQ